MINQWPSREVPSHAPKHLPISVIIATAFKSYISKIYEKGHAPKHLPISIIKPIFQWSFLYWASVYATAFKSLCKHQTAKVLLHRFQSSRFARLLLMVGCRYNYTF